MEWKNDKQSSHRFIVNVDIRIMTNKKNYIQMIMKIGRAAENIKYI